MFSLFLFFYFMFGDLNLIHMYETHGIFLLSLFVLIMYSMCYSMTINLIWIELNWIAYEFCVEKYTNDMTARHKLELKYNFIYSICGYITTLACCKFMEIKMENYIPTGIRLRPTSLQPEYIGSPK